MTKSSQTWRLRIPFSRSRTRAQCSSITWPQPTRRVRSSRQTSAEDSLQIRNSQTPHCKVPLWMLKIRAIWVMLTAIRNRLPCNWRRLTTSWRWISKSPQWQVSIIAIISNSWTLQMDNNAEEYIYIHYIIQINSLLIIGIKISWIKNSNKFIINNSMLQKRL